MITKGVIRPGSNIVTDSARHEEIAGGHILNRKVRIVDEQPSELLADFLILREISKHAADVYKKTENQVDVHLRDGNSEYEDADGPTSSHLCVLQGRETVTQFIVVIESVVVAEVPASKVYLKMDVVPSTRHLVLQQESLAQRALSVTIILMTYSSFFVH